MASKYMLIILGFTKIDEINNFIFRCTYLILPVLYRFVFYLKVECVWYWGAEKISNKSMEKIT